MKCKKCGEEKTVSQMAKFAGKPTELCKACRWSKGEKAPAAPDIAAVPVKTQTVPQPVALPTECSVAASLGFSARVDGDALVISQANSSRENDDDNITLTRSEAKRLFDTFGEWIVAT